MDKFTHPKGRCHIVVVSTEFSRLKHILCSVGLCAWSSLKSDVHPIMPLRSESIYKILNVQRPPNTDDIADYVGTMRYWFSMAVVRIVVVFCD